jgi:predicted ester cyclase
VTAAVSAGIGLVARRLYDEVWNGRRYDVAEEIVHPEFRSAAAPGLRGGAAKVAAIRGYHAAFPDLQVEIVDLVVGADRVAARLTFSGTDTGGLKGRPPTGRPIRSWTAEFLTFTDGRISGDWVGSDWLGTFVQLGVLPDPWPRGTTASRGRADG